MAVPKNGVPSLYPDAVQPFVLVPAADRGIPAPVRRAVIERDGLVCQLCGCSVEPGAFHLDHIVPWAEGGEHSVDNLRVACPPCNLRRPTPVDIVRRIAPPGQEYDWIRKSPRTRRREARRRNPQTLANQSPELAMELEQLLARAKTMSARQLRAARR